MATDHARDPHHSHGEDGPGPINHETTDISLEGIGRILIGFAVLMLLVTGAMWWTFRVLDRRIHVSTEAVAPMADRQTDARPTLTDTANDMERLGRTPAGPKLLTDEPAFLSQYQTDQQRALATYGWTDKATGVVRIPIDRAKQLIVERGLPQAVPGAPAEPPVGDP